MKTVLLIGTLDTKGPEIAYVRDRLHALGLGTIVADSGILSGPLDFVPDVSRAEVARLGGRTLDTLRHAGSRDVMVVHAVVDILGLNPISTALFDNVAAAMAGMLASGTQTQPPSDHPR